MSPDTPTPDLGDEQSAIFPGGKIPVNKIWEEDAPVIEPDD